jgi:hypothetical protein
MPKKTKKILVKKIMFGNIRNFLEDIGKRSTFQIIYEGFRCEHEINKKSFAETDSRRSRGEKPNHRESHYARCLAVSL